MSGSPKRTSVFSRIRRDRSESPRHRPVGKGRRDGGVFNRLGGNEKSVSVHSKSRYQSSRPGKIESVPRKRRYEGTYSQRMEMLSESEDSWGGGTLEVKIKKAKMPNNVKTYNGSDDLEDHLKIFQAAAKVERWAMPTWCHTFNSALTGSARVWFDDLPPKSVDSYDDLKKAFLANFLQQKKYTKDPVEIHHINQKEGESTKDFVQRFKAESRHVKGASECMRISGFRHGITNPELIKRLHDNIPKSVDEMMRVTTVNQQRSERRRDKFTLLTKSPKEILALDKGKFKTPSRMTTPAEKRNNNKFSEFHGEVGHNTDECMYLRRQIKELIKGGKLSHVIKELKQGSKNDQPMTAKKEESSGKDKPLEILMVQPWQRVARQKITQSFSLNPEISFPPLGDEDGAKGPMIIEALSGSKKPNGSSHRTPHWLKLRNHMTNGTNIDAGKNRGCGAFHLYMDEFCGGKITISVQWDHRKAGSEKNSSSPINSSWNVKIPSSRRNTHSTEQ
ncbi:reverse transcriptase domain-containing protein [Tanacetum coccineum]